MDTRACAERAGRDISSSAMRSTRERTGSSDRFSFQVAVFGAFSAAWTAVALLITGPRHGRRTQAVVLLALIGAASMFLAPTAGRRVDRYGADRVNLWCVRSLSPPAPSF
ncbi:hypothetical protein [Streptomyces sp. NPDC017435]|uniref:hypothetical protein n=1 Tax=Streptomyces sp. NPDC017435 TaxID=3364995 RepID=UPI003797FE29